MSIPDPGFEELGRGASLEEIQELERRLEVKFPEDYVNFAIKYAGSRYPRRSDYSVPGEGGAGFGFFLDIVVDEEHGEDIPSSVPRLWFLGPLPRKVVPIIRGGGGDRVCIDFRGAKPKIVFYEPGLKPEGEEPIVPLADSFTEFLGMLTEPNDPE